MQLLLPAALDLDAHLAAWPPPVAAFRRENLVHLLHLVAVIPATNRKVAARLAESRGYVPLRAARLRQWLPAYQEYLRYAIDSGLLETDNFYLEPHAHRQGKCRGYRFAAPYRGSAADSFVPAGPDLILRDEPAPLGLVYARRSQVRKLKRDHRDYVPLVQWLGPSRFRQPGRKRVPIPRGRWWESRSAQRLLAVLLP